jgi:hypothetical protein
MARKARPSTPLDPGAIPWLLAVALATAAPHAGNVPLWLAALVGAAIVWRGVLWWKKAGLPVRWHLALFVVAGVAGIGWEYRTLFGRDAGVALLVFFMALKPMEMRTQRDAIVVVMLGFFLLLTHYFYSQTIPTGLWLLASATLLTATLIRVYGGRQPPLTIVRYAGLMLAQALPFMLIAFMLFPRVSGPLWGLPQDAHSGLSGLSERMAPGSLNDLILSAPSPFASSSMARSPNKRNSIGAARCSTTTTARTGTRRAPGRLTSRQRNRRKSHRRSKRAAHRTAT